MINAIRFVKAPQPNLLPYSINASTARKASSSISTVRFRQVTTLATEHPHPETMAQQSADHKDLKNIEIQDLDNTGPDLMAHSFGEGYATRSDEEGFGGIYGGNQSLLDKKIHENHPAYDKSQGCEVKEKEKARNQKSADS